MADLVCNLGKFTLKNPVMTASGTFGYGFEYHNCYDISRLGAVVVKGIRMTPSHGNPTPRVAEVTGGMLNAIGPCKGRGSKRSSTRSTTCPSSAGSARR